MRDGLGSMTRARIHGGEVDGVIGWECGGDLNRPAPMAERLIQEGMRWRADILGPAPGLMRASTGACPWWCPWCPCELRATRYSPATCFFIANTSLSSSMQASSVISMPQLAWIAGSFAHVTLSPCTCTSFMSTAGRSDGARAH